MGFAIREPQACFFVPLPTSCVNVDKLLNFSELLLNEQTNMSPPSLSCFSGGQMTSSTHRLDSFPLCPDSLLVLHGPAGSTPSKTSPGSHLAFSFCVSVLLATQWLSQQKLLFLQKGIVMMSENSYLKTKAGSCHPGTCGSGVSLRELPGPQVERGLPCHWAPCPEVLWVLEAVTLSKGHPLVLGPPRDVDSDGPRPQFNPFICFLGALTSIPCPRACSFPPFKW